MNESREAALREIAALAARHELAADEILAALQPEQHPDPAVRSTGVLARVLAWLGGVLVLAGIALFINLQWDEFNSALRVLVTLGSGFAIFLFALASLHDERFAGVTTPMLLVAALLQPTGLVVMLDEYARGGEPEHGLLFVCGVMFTQQFLVFLAWRRTVLLFTSLFFAAAGFGTACNILDIHFEVVALALGIGLVAVSYSLDRGPHRAITPFWYFAGSVFLLGGAFEIIEDSPLEIGFFGLAAGFMYLGVVVRSRVLSFVSVIALTSFTGWYFRDSLANAFGLMVMGVLLIGLSAFAMSLHRRFIHAPGVAHRDRSRP